MSVPSVHDATGPGLAGPLEERQLRLLGRFDLINVHLSALGNAGQRLLALLAVHAGALARWQAAQVLYPQAADAQAAANLRAVLWRLQRCCPAVLDVTATEIRLAAGVSVDYWTAEPAARRLLSPTTAFDAGELAEALRAKLRDDLLPGWPEPWLVPEREQFHQLRLHALEALCARLTGSGLHGAAVDVGLAVVSADPLRESARHVLIDAYLAEANTCEAVRQFDAFRILLHAELGLQPTDALRHRLAAGALQRWPTPQPGAHDQHRDPGRRAVPDL
jgi:DNA-binding SARP family transcriptional activator